MAKLALAFPGQGAYLAGLFPHGAELPRVAELLAQVDAVAERHGGRAVAGYINGTDPQVGPDDTPPDLAIFASEVACHAVLDELGVASDVYVGHSFGEWAALTCAGAVDLSDAVRLVCGRASVLASSGVTGAMTAMRTDARRAGHLVGLLDDGRLALAVDNGPEQAVLAGPTDLLDVAERVAAEVDIDTARLSLAYPFHTSAFVPAQRALAALAADLEVRAPDVPVYSPILGTWVATVGQVRDIVRRHLSAPVGFYPALLALHRDGVRTFIECGPRGTLTKIIQDSLPAPVAVLAPWRRPARLDDVAALVGRSVTRAGTTPDARPSSGTNGSARSQDVDPADQEVQPAASDPRTAEPPRPEPAVAALEAHDGVDAAPASDTPPGDRAGLVRWLRTRYAEQLGLPEELLTDDTDLEADLGVDSIKQVAIFQQLRQDLQLPQPSTGLRITSYTTLPAIADLLRKDHR